MPTEPKPLETIRPLAETIHEYLQAITVEDLVSAVYEMGDEEWTYERDYGILSRDAEVRLSFDTFWRHIRTHVGVDMVLNRETIVP